MQLFLLILVLGSFLKKISLKKGMKMYFHGCVLKIILNTKIPSVYEKL